MEKLKISSKTIILLIIIVVIGVVTIWVLSRFGGTSPADLTNLLSPGSGQSDIDRQKLPDKSMFDDGLEKDGRWRQLYDFREGEINVGKPGRSNPFAKP